jgi:hypothetical protein|tara:strand:+ start:86 stop:286 length:201 start_codon:yes stop_codon:yes gene_type:complete
MDKEKFACINAIAITTIFPMGLILSPILGVTLMLIFAKILKTLEKRVATDRKYSILRLLPVNWEKG